jgi:hypothetical protein
VYQLTKQITKLVLRTELKKGDRVYCVHGPVVADISGTVNKVSHKVHVIFDNGLKYWCKDEWLDLEGSPYHEMMIGIIKLKMDKFFT